MRHFKVTFSNGDSLVTGFNGTLADARAYYVGNRFNIGDGAGGDLETIGEKVEEIIS